MSSLVIRDARPSDAPFLAECILAGMHLYDFEEIVNDDLADVYTVIGRFQPYAGITLGGGAGTTLLMGKAPEAAWKPVDDTVYNKQGFMALDPFVGCDFILGGPVHLTLKVDWLSCLGKNVTLPSGPRVYLGILFYR